MDGRIRRFPAIVGIIFAASAVLLAEGPGSGAAVTARYAHLRTGTVHVAKLSVGRVLVNAAGKTVYVFSSDKHRRPTCTSACAGYWPPLLAGHVHPGSGVKKKWLGTVKAADGKRQVTYHHWPLYTFTGDTKNGEATGQGMHVFGGTWSTIGANGRTDFRARAAAAGGGNSSSTTSTTSGSKGTKGGTSPSSSGQGNGSPPASSPTTSPPTTTPPPTTSPPTTTPPPTTSPPTTTPPPTTSPPTTTPPPYGFAPVRTPVPPGGP